MKILGRSSVRDLWVINQLRWCYFIRPLCGGFFFSLVIMLSRGIHDSNNMCTYGYYGIVNLIDLKSVVGNEF